MTNLRNNQRPSTNGARRRGQAGLEVVFVLPMFLLIWGVIFTTGSVVLTRSGAELLARNNAFSGRHTPWESSPVYEQQNLPVKATGDIGRILGSNPKKLDPNGGALRSELQLKVPLVFGPLQHVLGPVEGKSFVLGGSWDHQEIEFERHGRLVLTEKANYFGPKLSNLAAFLAL